MTIPLMHGMKVHTCAKPALKPKGVLSHWQAFIVMLLLQWLLGLGNWGGTTASRVAMLYSSIGSAMDQWSSASLDAVRW